MNKQEILSDLNDDFFLSTELGTIELMIAEETISREAVERKWLGYPPATVQQIRDKEQQLGIILPPSYKEFLLTSNGFRWVAFYLDNLFSIGQIDWAKNVEDPWWLDLLQQGYTEVPDDVYFIYGEEQKPEWSRDEYVKDSLKVSEWYDGMCIFLNPKVKYEEEWEVLEYTTWLPGTRRYRSFKEYLIETHKRNVGFQERQARNSS